MDIAHRDQYEAKLARALGRALHEQFTIVMTALGAAPSAANLTPMVFENMQKALQAAIRPILERVYLAQVEALTHEIIPRTKQGIGVEWGVVNQRAAEWASRYSFDLVSGIVDTTRVTLQRQVADFFTDQRTLGDLRAAIEPLFGPVRADMIATTEITRAASAGEQAFADELEALGLTTTQVWQTNQDDAVCPICGPRHNKKRGDGWDELPPAHVRCRCWTNTVVEALRALNLPAVIRAKRAEGYTGFLIEKAA